MRRIVGASAFVLALLTACSRPDDGQDTARRAVEALVRGDAAAYGALSAPEHPPPGWRPEPSLPAPLAGALAGCASVPATYGVQPRANPAGAEVTVRFSRPCTAARGTSDAATLVLERTLAGGWRVVSVAW
jgi:hypothetical protein